MTGDDRPATPALRALLDASVMIPASLNDTLLLMAEAGFYRVAWSDEILDEVERNLVSDGLTTPERAAHRINVMRDAFPRATVTGYQPLVERMTKHSTNRHVLAAAVAGSASIIVTHNRRHFPPVSLEPHAIRAVSPDAFLLAIDDVDPDRVTAIIDRQASILRSPSMLPRDVLDRLKVHAPGFVERLSGRFG